jgi:hypothetical protein
MANVTIEVPATDPASAGNLPEPGDPEDPETMHRTDVCSRLALLSVRWCSSSMSLTVDRSALLASAYPIRREAPYPWLQRQPTMIGFLLVQTLNHANPLSHG